MTQFGLDTLGIGSRHWDIKSTLTAWPHGFFVGAFDGIWPNAFGDPTKNIQALFNQTDCPGARIHIWWSYDHKAVDIKVLNSRLPHWEQFAKRNPSKRIYISHSCEYGPSASQAQLQQLIAAIRLRAPSCIPVNVPEGGAVMLPGVVTEHHGSGAHVNAGGLASTDGSDITNVNSAAWIVANQHADVCFLWAPRFNMSESHQSDHNPSARTAGPNAQFIRAVSYLSTPILTAPVPTFPAHPVARPDLYKCFAEDMQGSNPRDNLPLIELYSEKAQQSTVQIVTHNKQVVGVFKHFADVRYYSGLPGGINLWGFQIAQKAVALSGSPYVWFLLNGNYHGPVDAGRRSGFFQNV